MNIFVFILCLIHLANSYLNNKNIFFENILKRNIKLKAKNEKPQIDSKIINYFKNIRNEFPFFQRKDCPIYFDSAATTHKPNSVIKKIENFYKNENSNIHRGIYKISLEATNNYENVRDIIKNYINCDSREEIIFTNGATYGLNLVCKMIMDKIIKKKDDEIHLTYLEHHSNIIPWQEEIIRRKKGKIKYIPLKKSGYINIKKLEKNINSNTKVLSISHVSNVLGNIQNINLIIKKVKKINSNIIIIIDAAQSFPHIKYDIKKMKSNNSDPDILIASGHKFCAPLGSGFIYMKKSLTSSFKFKPLLYGSNIITNVSKYKSKFVSPPYLFETGTQNISGILSMGAAIQFLQKIDWNFCYSYEMYLYDLLIYYLQKFLKHKLIQLPLTNSSKKYDHVRYNSDVQNYHNSIENNIDEVKNYFNLNTNDLKIKNNDSLHTHSDLTNIKNDTHNTDNSSVEDLKIYIHNTKRFGLKKVGILPLWSNKFSSFDLVTFLDFKNICIRSGNHCTTLLHKHFLKIPDSSRISIYFYNTPEEISYLAEQIATTSIMLNDVKK
ncbi:cysteine desulfurase, putative [Plasmodium gallinaceum]|uniref:Cysteine desulfurase, putative n=1 Tax=Plasmodium gallinaceum TaxID=5849 RepID=A0A1J1H000_PLAGA|nr:cysteine desulfurase, putative [Plasmodium gallinaceum]CRG98198.1 cysteine desulfurase, putative [Plasmodium gallinaceum]